MWISETILAKIDGESYLIDDLDEGKPIILNKQQFNESYYRQIIPIASIASILEQLAK